MIHEKVYRHELKYYIGYSDYKYLKEKFKNIMEVDYNAKINNQYWIRSLYFDTIRNSDYYDKTMGTEKRKKIRLRIYSVNQEKVKIEIKNKFGQYMLKETDIIYRKDAYELIKGNRAVLLKYNTQVCNKVYYLMSMDYYRPSIIVDYEREAFFYPIENIRITFDKNIRSSIGDFDIFNENLHMTPIFHEPTMVLEVKYNRVLPIWIKRSLSNCNGANSSISKYCISRQAY